MNLSFSARAEADLDSIFEYIHTRNPRAADRTLARILQSLSVLESFPLIGRPGRVNGTREWSISGLPYVGVYRIVDEIEVQVIAVIHSSQIWP